MVTQIILKEIKAKQPSLSFPSKFAPPVLHARQFLKRVDSGKPTEAQTAEVTHEVDEAMDDTEVPAPEPSPDTEKRIENCDQNLGLGMETEASVKDGVPPAARFAVTTTLPSGKNCCTREQRLKGLRAEEERLSAEFSSVCAEYQRVCLEMMFMRT